MLQAGAYNAQEYMRTVVDSTPLLPTQNIVRLTRVPASEVFTYLRSTQIPSAGKEKESSARDLIRPKLMAERSPRLPESCNRERLVPRAPWANLGRQAASPRPEVLMESQGDRVTRTEVEK